MNILFRQNILWALVFSIYVCSAKPYAKDDSDSEGASSFSFTQEEEIMTPESSILCKADSDLISWREFLRETPPLAPPLKLAETRKIRQFHSMDLFAMDNEDRITGNKEIHPVKKGWFGSKKKGTVSRSESISAFTEKSAPKILTIKRKSRRPACCSPCRSYANLLGSYGNSLSGRELKGMDKILLFLCHGKSQTVATMAMASTFLNIFRKDYKNTKFRFTDFFNHIIGVSAGSIPAAGIAFDKPIDEVIETISSLPAKPAIDAISLVTGPSWIIAKSTVKGLLMTDKLDSDAESRLLPTQYDVFMYKPLYEAVSKICEQNPKSRSKSKLYIHAASPKASVKNQVIRSIMQYDATQTAKNSRIEREELISLVRAGAEIIGFDQNKVDQAIDFFTTQDEHPNILPYEEIVTQMYKTLPGKSIIVSFSSRTSNGDLSLMVSPTVKGNVAHIDYCITIPEEMYKSKVIDIKLFKEKALEFMGRASKYDGAAKLTGTTFDLMKRYLNAV